MAERSHGRVVDRKGKQRRDCTGGRALDDGDLGAAQARAGIDHLCLRPTGDDSRKCYAEWYEKWLLLHAARP